MWEFGDLDSLFLFNFPESMYVFSSVQFSSVTQSFLTHCNPMNHSTPGLPVHHQLPEFTQTHVHRVSDAFALYKICHRSQNTVLISLKPFSHGLYLFSHHLTKNDFDLDGRCFCQLWALQETARTLPPRWVLWQNITWPKKKYYLFCICRYPFCPNLTTHWSCKDALEEGLTNRLL